MTINIEKIEKLTSSLLEEIGEDISREGLVKTPNRVARAWEYFSHGYRADLDNIINNAI
ncbi:MAG: GTP cyclohydrolase I, partial [Candidatus Neomarinimicrobiota bacterium]